MILRPASRLTPALTVALAAVLTACDDTGPGELDVSVLGGSAAAVVALTGEGITGIEPVGGTRAYGAPGSVPGTYRVVLVGPVPGTLRFRVAVEDRSMPVPRGHVVEATDGHNQPIPVSGLEVRIEEP